MARGIEPYWCVHHGLTVSMYYADPDGNQMEFQVDAFESMEEAGEYVYMRGPEMAGVISKSPLKGVGWDL